MASIINSVEKALYNLYTSSSLSSSLNVLKGIDDETKTGPLLIVAAGPAREDFPDSYVWHVSTNLMVKMPMADYTEDEMGTACDQVFGMLLNEGTGLGAHTNDLAVYDIMVVNTNDAYSGDYNIQSLTCDIIAVNT